MRSPDTVTSNHLRVELLEQIMADVTENQVRELAYQLWERDGHQDGMSDQYWKAAEKLLADETDTPLEEPSLLEAVPPLIVAGIK